MWVEIDIELYPRMEILKKRIIYTQKHTIFNK